ncbi:unnamed protein product [Calypogeia fissa]
MPKIRSSIATCSSTLPFLTTVGLTVRSLHSGGHLIMSTLSNFSNFSTAAPHTSCLLSYDSNLRTEKTFAIPFRNLTTKCRVPRGALSHSREGCSCLSLHASCLLSSHSNLITRKVFATFIPLRNGTSKCGLSREASSPSRDGFSCLHTCYFCSDGLSTRVAPSSSYEVGFSCVNTCCGFSDGICNAGIALSAGCSRRHRSAFGVVHRPVTTKLGFLHWRAVGPSFKGLGVFQIARSSSVFRRGIHGLETRHGLGSHSEFHTAARQEGRYLCAQEDFGLEAFEEGIGEGIEHENGDGRGVETVGTDAGEVEKETCAREIWVVNFYHFVGIEDPHHEVARHTSVLEGKDVRGRIYISHQGINAQLSGPEKEAIKYAEWVKEDSRFADMLVQISPSPGGHAFPRLRLRYKPSLVQVEGGTLHLPVTDRSARAVHLSPREWTERLDAATLRSNKSAAISQELGRSQDEQHDKGSKASKPVVLLDVRNGYEWDVGHFKGAQRPNVDCFKSTEFGLKDNETVRSDPLANVDKEVVDVMMYCTGGIRCDVFSTMLRQKGFKNLYTLKGGVSNYLKEEGARKWAGNLFVFDSRLAVPPKDYNMNDSSEDEALAESDASEEMSCANSSASQAFARCQLCGDPISEPRHRNCANLDCNLLYLSCKDCLSQNKGCCSTSCSAAPRLRPLLARHQYDRWHKYRPQEPKPPKPADYVSRRALKRRRRKERRKLLASEQLNVQILDSHESLTEIHDEPSFATIVKKQQ